MILLVKQSLNSIQFYHTLMAERFKIILRTFSKKITMQSLN